jgi:hypothetical protein
MLLILHPAYRESYTFKADGDEALGNVNTTKFRFKSVPGASSPIMVRIRGQNYSVELEGTVWVESQSGNVVKLIASSESSMNEVGVKSMTSEIEYLPAAFHVPEESYWMPASAVIDVKTEHTHWRNIHRFTSYHRLEPTTASAEQK